MALLFESGQAFAVSYTSRSNISSATDFTDGTKWASNTTNCTGSATGGTITPTATDFFGICPGHSLTLAVTDVVNFGTLAFGRGAPGGTWGGGVLKFSAGNKTLANYNSSLAPIALNISSMATGDSIAITGAVTFSSVTGGSLTCGGAAYTAGTAIAAGTTCTVTVVAPPAVSAPLDFDFNNPAKVFTTEIKVK